MRCMCGLQNRGRFYVGFATPSGLHPVTRARSNSGKKAKTEVILKYRSCGQRSKACNRKRGTRMSNGRRSAIFSATVLLLFTQAIAQEGQMETKHVRWPDAPAATGEEMYLSYCAVCHGIDGKGGGPATPALRDQVPDLTTLSQRHGGKYPAQYVENVLRFGTDKDFPAHGNKDMPIWGQFFASMPRSDKHTVTQRISNLTQYLGTLQTK